MEHATDAARAAASTDDRAERIRVALQDRFNPVLLRVADDSAKHAGHAGARPGGQTHYSVLIVSDAFAGLSRVARHRAVNDTLMEEFAAGLHALAVQAKAPGEA